MGAMTKATLIVALLLTASPVAAQVSTFDGQSQLSALGGQFVPSEAPTSAPTTGVICIEGIAGTFCNVPAGPNAGGYGSGAGSGSGGGASAGGITSIPPCGTAGQ